MGTLLNVGAFFSGRVQNGFETQNGFTRSGFRGIPSLVPKFAFLVVEIGLRKPPNLTCFQKLALFTKSLSICFWFDSERFWDVNHSSEGFLKYCSNFCLENCFFIQKKGVGARNLRLFLKNCTKLVDICSCKLI